MTTTRGLQRSAGLPAGGDHLPPARLLGADGPQHPDARRGQGLGHEAPLRLHRRARAQGHQVAPRRGRLAAARAPRRRLPANRPRPGPRRDEPRARPRRLGARHSDGEIVDLLRGGQGVFNIVPLGGVIDDLAADDRRARRARADAPPRARPRRRDRRDAAATTAGDPGPAHPSALPRRGRRSRTPPSGSSRPCSTSTGSRGATSPSSSRSPGTTPGDRRRAFRPDFYLPEHSLLVELTVADQRLVTRKNAKVRRMRELYPELTSRSSTSGTSRPCSSATASRDCSPLRPNLHAW